jgi:hypothetical protein
VKPLCLVPCTSLDIGPSGNIAPCCKFRAQTRTQNKNYDSLNINKNTISEYASSDYLNAIKQDMLKNEWPEGCSRCRIEEESNIKSKRILDYERWPEEFDNYTPEMGFIIASIIFGNTCNLKCITCKPVASSRWRKEYKELYGIDIPHNKFIPVTCDDIFDALPNAIHFDILGGEPFLSEVDKQLDLLKRYIDSGQSKHMSLHYTTNTQIYPEDKWWALWENFKEIDMQLSIDGIEDRYEYIRYPGKFEILEKNIQKYIIKEKKIDNFKLSVSHTVSAYNIYYLDEFFNWCNKTGLPEPWCAIVYDPFHMCPSVYKKEIRKEIADHLNKSTINDVNAWANYMLKNDSSEYYETFLTMRDKHDSYRNTNFATVFPEIEKLINN